MLVPTSVQQTPTQWSGGTAFIVYAQDDTPWPRTER